MSRRVQILHEAGAPAAVAERLFRGALGIVGRYVGAISVSAVREVRLNDASVAFPRRIGFRTEGHRAILTARPIWGDAIRRTDPLTGFSNVGTPNAQGIITDSLVVVKYDPTDMLAQHAMRDALRGIGRSFGVEGCGKSQTSCVMGREVIRITQLSSHEPDPQLQNPYCDSCADKLTNAKT